MTSPALEFTENDQIGRVAGVDTSRVAIDVSNSEMLTRVGIGQLIAIKGATQAEFLIGMTDRVTRSLREELPDPEGGEFGALTVSPADHMQAFVIGTTSFLLMCSDQVKKRWEDAASRDHLTELPNRRSLISYGEANLEIAPSGSYNRALAMLDIDEFKCINDGYGHQSGDEVLQEIAERIVDVLHPEDFIARSGGEEFVVIFGEKGSMSPEISAERVRQAVASKTFQIGTTTIPVTVSIGVVVCRANATFSETLSRADKALYAAKNKGRNQVVFAA